jgi:hypothetical protein
MNHAATAAVYWVRRPAQPAPRHRKPIRSPLRLLGVDTVRRKCEADRENDREPDQPHGHLDGGWLAGSLAERHDAH